MKRMNSVLSGIVMTCMLFACPACAVTETATVQVESKLQQVALFKNGLGFFISEVAVPEKVTSFSVVPLAAPSHGTFWISYTHPE